MRKAQKRRVCSSLRPVLREFVEVCTPCVFLLHILLIRNINPKMNHLLCRLTDDDFRNMVIFVLIDIAVELAIGIFTYVFLRRKGYHPFALLRGLAREHRRVFITAPTTMWIYFWALWHTNMGVDLTMQFRWFRQPGSQWLCGMVWDSA